MESRSHSAEKLRNLMKHTVPQPATSNISFIISQRLLQGWPLLQLKRRVPYGGYCSTAYTEHRSSLWCQSRCVDH